MEGDAGTRQLNPTDAEDAPNHSVAVSEEEQTGQEHLDSPATEVAEETGVDRRGPRLGRGWLAGVCVALVALTAAAVVGGVLLIRDNRGIDEINRNDAAALQAARDCITALQAPDTAAMNAAQMKIME